MRIRKFAYDLFVNVLGGIIANIIFNIILQIL